MPKALLGDQLPSRSGILSGALGKTVSGKKSAGRLAQLRVVRNLFVSAASSWIIWPNHINPRSQRRPETGLLRSGRRRQEVVQHFLHNLGGKYDL